MLAAPFETTHHDIRGGVAIEYLTGEQVISRLLAVLGTCGWSFRILQHDIHVEADEVWVLGELRLLLNGDDPVVRQHFGSSKIKRARNTGTPLDIGFDFKSAATDCLKKCATLVGVGLYLTRKEEKPQHGAPSATEPNGARQHVQRQRSSTTTEHSARSAPALPMPQRLNHVRHWTILQTSKSADRLIDKNPSAALMTAGFLQEFTGYLERRTDCPIEFHLHAGMAALSVALGNRVWCDGWARPIHPNLWIVLIAKSGYGKSVPLDMSEALVRKAGLEASVLPDSFSQEALYTLLSHHPAAIFYLQEFSAFLASLHMYSPFDDYLGRF